MAKAIRKPLSFSTTTRNPARIAALLKCVLPYENYILDNNIMCAIMSNAIKHKLYQPMHIKRTPRLTDIYNSEDSFSDADVREIMENSPQRHKEAGFDYGWPSRFDTFFKLAKEFGFVYYWPGERIFISETGHMLIDAVNEEEPNLVKIQKVFLNALMKYQTNNPFRKNLNSNAPLPLLLQVIKMLKNTPNTSTAGVCRRELPLFICAQNSDANILYEEILRLRQRYGFGYSDDVIYDICFRYLEATPAQIKRFKMSQITSEAVDEYIRKMRITGILSLRGNGRFIDFNSFEQDTIDYVLETYVNYPVFTSELEYFKYMSSIDSRILEFHEAHGTDVEDVKQRTLSLWAKEKSFEFLSDELTAMCGKKTKSNDDILRLLDRPTRFEFLTSIIIKKRYPDLIAKPNYSVDDEGLPKFTAAGGKADIECFDDDNNPIVEVTLLQSRGQSIGEIPAITRHLSDAKVKFPEKFVFTIFIAPSIHKDTVYMTDFSKYRYGVDIIPLTTAEFIDELRRKSKLKYFVDYESNSGDMLAAEPQGGI